MTGYLYLDTSAILRPLLDEEQDPEVEKAIGDAELLVTSRLSLVETARALLRVRNRAERSEEAVADAERSLRSLWRHCEIWELSREVCELAELVAPKTLLRTLDALHLATYLIARREIEGLELLTTDERLREAAAGN